MDDRTPEFQLTEIVRQLHCCSRQLRLVLSEQLRPCRLTDSEFLLLWICHQSGDEALVQGHIVAKIGLSPAQLSGLVDRLHKRNLLALERSDSDRRCQLLRMTDQGVELFQQAINSLSNLAESVTRRVNPPNLDAITDIASQLVTATQEVGAELPHSESTNSRRKGAAA